MADPISIKDSDSRLDYRMIELFGHVWVFLIDNENYIIDRSTIYEYVVSDFQNTSLSNK